MGKTNDCPAIINDEYNGLSICGVKCVFTMGAYGPSPCCLTEEQTPSDKLVFGLLGLHMDRMPKMYTKTIEPLSISLYCFPMRISLLG